MVELPSPGGAPLRGGFGLSAGAGQGSRIPAFLAGILGCPDPDSRTGGHRSAIDSARKVGIGDSGLSGPIRA